MTRLKNQYILESSEENERLERQSQMRAFDFRLELQHLHFTPGQRVLDAGCGTGIVTDYLARSVPGVTAVGWDFSRERVDAARAKYGSTPNISFAQQNLLRLDADAALDARESFDAVVCRFVLRHFSSEDVKKVIQNIFKVLKPGGTLYCVDVDGVLGEVASASPSLKRALDKLRYAKGVDFQAARKMPALLMSQGFQNVDWHLITSEFKGDELVQEISNLRQSIKNAEGFAKKILGGAAKMARFQEEYFSALQEPGYVHFYTKVIASGIKPKTKLQLIM